MSAQAFGLAWIVVKDVKASIKFYTEVVGLKLVEFHEQFGWAELEGSKGGARLGIAQMNDHCPSMPNAIMTFTVKDLDQSTAEMLAKGALKKGEIEEVSGHVRMQMFVDADGHHFQMVQVAHSCAHC